jgi:hypothetical protein
MKLAIEQLEARMKEAGAGMPSWFANASAGTAIATPSPTTMGTGAPSSRRGRAGPRCLSSLVLRGRSRAQSRGLTPLSTLRGMREPTSRSRGTGLPSSAYLGTSSSPKGQRWTRLGDELDTYVFDSQSRGGHLTVST